MLDDNGREDGQDGQDRQVTVTVRELLALQDVVGNRLQTVVLWVQDLLNLHPEIAEHPAAISAVEGVTEHAQAAADEVRQFVTRLTGGEPPSKGSS